MGTIRKRFTPAERELFTRDTAVEWLDATHWKTGVVSGPVEQDESGYQVLPVRNTGRTGFLYFGEVAKVNAKHVRLAG